MNTYHCTMCSIMHEVVAGGMQLEYLQSPSKLTVDFVTFISTSWFTSMFWMVEIGRHLTSDKYSNTMFFFQT